MRHALCAAHRATRPPMTGPTSPYSRSRTTGMGARTSSSSKGGRADAASAKGPGGGTLPPAVPRSPPVAKCRLTAASRFHAVASSTRVATSGSSAPVTAMNSESTPACASSMAARATRALIRVSCAGGAAAVLCELRHSRQAALVAAAWGARVQPRSSCWWDAEPSVLVSEELAELCGAASRCAQEQAMNRRMHN